MLVAENLTKSYGEVRALQGASLQVAEGQIVSLLGRNGAGKTTMLSIIAGLLRPDAGEVSIGGVDAFRKPEAAAKLVGIAPQDTGIYGVLTVRENLEFFGELSGLNRATRTAVRPRWPIGSVWVRCSIARGRSCPVAKNGASTRRARWCTPRGF